MDLPPVEIHQSYNEQYLKAFEQASAIIESLEDALLDENLPDELYFCIRNLFIKLSWYGTVLTAPEKLDELAKEIEEIIYPEPEYIECEEDEEEKFTDFPEEDWSFMLERTPNEIKWTEILETAKELIQVVLDVEVFSQDEHEI